MAFFQNKKSLSLAPEVLAIILISLAGFLVIFSFIPQFLHKAEAKASEEICKLSINAREKTYTEIKPGGIKLGSIAFPAACKTIDKYVPTNKDASKEMVEKEIATIMAKCWEQFGEGLIQDVFKEGDKFTKNCFVCYIVSLRETQEFKEVRSPEMFKYLFDNPYKTPTNADFCKINGGYCVNSEAKEDCYSKILADPSYILIKNKDSTCTRKGMNSCCYTEYGCWNKGGTCSSNNPDTNIYSEYSDAKWDCPPKMKCFAKKEAFFSYGDYIQRFGNPGNIIITTDLKPGETYAVSFGSPTKECSWCTYFGLGVGAGAVVGLAWIVGVPTGGVGAVTVLGLYAATGYIAGKSTSEYIGTSISTETIGSIMGFRNLNTIYLTTLNQLSENKDKVEYCNVIKDVTGR